MHMIILLYNYISNKGLLEECHKEENLEVIRAATVSCLKRILQNILYNVRYSPINHTPAPQ